MNSLALILLLFFTLGVALAFFWLAYTTFTSTASTIVTIRAATLYYHNDTLKLVVVNPGPNPVYINAVYLSGARCNITGVSIQPETVAEIYAVCPRQQAATAQGIVVANGYPLPFTASIS
ncbi:MAG: hypothetical protein RXN90_10335 [Thermoproteus sp.]